MGDLLSFGLPFVLLAMPSILIYLKLMKHITHRPINNGLNIEKERVDQIKIIMKN